MTRTPAALFLAVLASVALARAARAGGGPENVLVVVNADSPTSKWIANEYVRMRRIPATHVVEIPGVATLRIIDVDTFRERIWKPIRAFIEEQHLAEEIDVIAYSADFPYGVYFEADLKAAKGVQVTESHIAALTALTYFARHVEAKDARAYLDLQGNRYFRRETRDGERPIRRATVQELETERFRSLLERMEKAPSGVMPAHGFSSAAAWDSSGAPVEDEGSSDRYYLSTMLAYTGEWGNSVPEALAYLAAAAASDGTNPDGTVYLPRNGDLRSTTREPYFAGTEAALRRLGRKAEILDAGKDGQTGVLPVRKEDVIGAVVGIAGFSWAECKSRFLPGAIADHLTSLGGVFDNGSQTKLTEFLRYGAAGASGTVAEPLAIWMKFPLPYVHVHYAEGCSLAEAFYQSVYGPYQLLIVGDPLARPFAKFAQVAIESPSTATPWAGEVAVTAKVTPATGRPIARVELWVDGQRFADAPPGQPIPWDTKTAHDGWHEVRLVAVEADRIETRSSAILSVTVANTAHESALTGPKGPVPYGAPLVIKGKAAGAAGIELRSGSRLLGTCSATTGTWSWGAPSSALGMGTVPVVAQAKYADGTVVVSAPVEVLIAPPVKTKPKKPVKLTKPPKGGKPARGYADGLDVLFTDAAKKTEQFVVLSLGDLAKLVDTKNLGAARELVLEGEFEAKADGVYQLVANAEGNVRLDVDGAEALAAEAATRDRQVYGIVSLKAGWHRLRIVLEPKGMVVLNALLAGDQVAVPLGGKTLRHSVR